jgi:DNA repair exonuclease SbcCD ATPase subunit
MTRGAGTNIIALDEIDRAMSPYNTDRLVSLLDTIRGSIPTMFVISHNERTKNTMPADSVWTAVRKEGISHLEM